VPDPTEALLRDLKCITNTDNRPQLDQLPGAALVIATAPSKGVISAACSATIWMERASIRMKSATALDGMIVAVD
jgi:hypothetical protein